MDPVRRTSLCFGLWFLGAFSFSIPAFFLYRPVVDDAGCILGAGADTRIATGAPLHDR